RAAALGALGQLGDAVESADEALGRNPASVPALINKGLALQGLGQPVAARACLDAATRLRAIDPDAWLGLWAVQQEQGDAGGARRSLERAMRLGPVNLNLHGPRWVRRTEDTPALGTVG